MLTGGLEVSFSIYKCDGQVLCAVVENKKVQPPCGHQQTSWLSFVMSNCEVVTFPLVFWVMFGA